MTVRVVIEATGHENSPKLPNSFLHFQKSSTVLYNLILSFYPGCLEENHAKGPNFEYHYLVFLIFSLQ